MLHRLIFVTIAAITLSLFTPPALAQAPACNPAAVMSKAAALKTSGDNKKDMQALYAISQQITDAGIACDGIVFKGNGSKVLDSFAILQGKYKISALVTGYFSLKGEPTQENDCGLKSYDWPSLSGGSVATADAKGKPETVENTFTIKDDCRLILKTSFIGTAGTWAITITPVK